MKEKKVSTYSFSEDVPRSVSEPEVLYAVRQNTVTTFHLASLKNLSGLNDDVLAKSLNLNIKTFRSYKMKSSHLKPHLQEHVLALLALYRHGIDVFGDHKQFNHWLEKANHFFDNDRPVSFLNTIGGIRFVDSRLTAIEYGDNA